MESNLHIDYSKEEINKIREYEEEIKQKTKELNEYKYKLLFEVYNKPQSRQLCIVTYKRPIKVSKWLDPIKYEYKEEAALMWMSWENEWSGFGAHACFNHVAKDGGSGNEMYYGRVVDFTYELLDNMSVEDARKLLAQIKKEKKKEEK